MTFLNPSDIYLVKCELLCKWGLFLESHVSSVSLMCTLEKIVKPVVLKLWWRARRSREIKSEGKALQLEPSFFLLLVCLCLCLPLLHTPSLSLSLSLPLCMCLLLCHPQGCIWRRPSVDPFVYCFASFATASLLSTIGPGLSTAQPFLLTPTSPRDKGALMLGSARRLCPDSLTE